MNYTLNLFHKNLFHKDLKLYLRDRKRHRENKFLLPVHSANVGKGKGWARLGYTGLYVGARNRIQVSHVTAGAQLLRPSPFPCNVFISRKLGFGAGLG